MFRYIRPALNRTLRLPENQYSKRSQTTLKHCFGLHDTPNSIAIVSNVNEIHFNLAVEDYLMNVVRPSCPLFFWWRNASNVVIGRHQNPWRECRWELMQQDGVDLARRFSGGGAVYQDLGNSCFTLLLPENMYDSQKNNNIILNVLKQCFNIYGEASGRNDLVVNNKKVFVIIFMSYNSLMLLKYRFPVLHLSNYAKLENVAYLYNMELFSSILI
jgi:hypothetical protein